MKQLTIDIRPTEEESCNRKVIEIYNYLKGVQWIIVLIKAIGWWENRVDWGTTEYEYLRRLTHVIDITLESDLDCTTLATII